MDSPLPVRFSRRQIGLQVAFVLVTVLLLFGLGRVFWCQQGDVSPWSSEIDGAHNSQHLFDPYTLTHVLHGLGFWLLLFLVAGRRLDAAWRWVTATGLECLWEVVENTDTVINQYREATIALGYFGDSIANSLGDITACWVGCWLALRFPARVSVAMFVLIEAGLVLWIRDSLLLNILMLIWPLESVRQWQLGP